jgi:hypothetical protein
MRILATKLLPIALVVFVAACVPRQQDARPSGNAGLAAHSNEPQGREEWVETTLGRQLREYHSTGELKGRADFASNGRLYGFSHYDKAGRVRYAMSGVMVVVFDASALTREEFGRIREQLFADQFRKVYIRDNPHLDESAIDSLLTLSNLEEVHIGECPNIPASALERLKRERPGLKFEP